MVPLSSLETYLACFDMEQMDAVRTSSKRRCWCCCCRWVFAIVALLVLTFHLPAAVQLCCFGFIDRTTLPWDLPTLVVTKGSPQVRTLGNTAAGDPLAYKEVFLTEDQRAHYFRYGYTLVRNAVDPAILSSIRADLWNEVGPSSWPWAHSSFMTVDAVLDFYIFSNLPSLASQIFRSPESDTAGDPTTHLWSDFHYFRDARGGRIIDYHYDGMECEGTLPANHTSTSRLRVWVTLDDDALAPLLINQSFLISSFNETELEWFWSGRGRGVGPTDAIEHLRRLGRFPAAADKGTWTRLPRLQRGDLLLHSPCLVHASPPPFGRHAAFLCATYAPAASRVWHEANAGAPFRSCKRSRPQGEEIRGIGDPCLPQVYPRDPALRNETKLRFEAVNYTATKALLAWLRYRWYRIVGHLLPAHHQPQLDPPVEL